jgi:ABC-type transport system substrate-binding protein
MRSTARRLQLRRAQWIIAGAILVLLAAACASDPTDAPSTSPPVSSSPQPTTTALLEPVPTSTTAPPTRSPSGPGYGGVAVIGDDQSPRTINPYAPGGTDFIVTVVGQAWLTGVWDIDAATREIIPEVVETLPTVTNGGVVVNDDGTMTVNYRIRDEAQWEDGTPISGYDLQFTLDTVLALERNSETQFGYTDAAIVSSDPGDKTFSMTLARPTLLFEDLFRWLIPKHAVEGTAFPDDWIDTPWPSGGPFIIDTISPGDRIVMVRNANYWKTDEAGGLQLPFLDGVEFRFSAETSSLIRAFANRDIDVFHPPPSIRDVINTLEKLEAEGATVTVLPGRVWEHINFQFGPGRFELSPNSCNENLAFRRAIMHAVDRDAATSAIFGDLNTPVGSYVDAFSPTLATDAWARYPYDPDLARELYAQAVEETGRACTAVFSTSANAEMRPRLANLYVDMLAEAGIPMELELMDSQPFFGEVLPEGSWDVGQWAWVGSAGLSALVEFHSQFDPQGLPPDGSNFYRWGTPDSSVNNGATRRFATIVEAMNTTVDDAQLRSLIAEAEGILADQAVILPLFSRLVVGAVWGDEIGGYVLNISRAGPTWNIEEWYRTDR